MAAAHDVHAALHDQHAGGRWLELHGSHSPANTGQRLYNNWLDM